MFGIQVLVGFSEWGLDGCLPVPGLIQIWPMVLSFCNSCFITATVTVWHGQALTRLLLCVESHYILLCWQQPFAGWAFVLIEVIGGNRSNVL